jgi:hypothetical protein
MLSFVAPTVAIVIWAFVIWPPAGKFMLFVLVIAPFMPETWWIAIELYRGRRARKKAVRV